MPDASGRLKEFSFPGADKPERTAQRILPEDSEADVKLAKEDPAGGKRPRRENFLYMPGIRGNYGAQMPMFITMDTRCI